MTANKKWVLLGLCFAALLAGPAIYQRLSETSPAARPIVTVDDREELIARYGLWLEESASEAGIDFEHTPPRIDSRLAHIEPQIASMGAAVSVIDFNHDGWLDIYLTNSSPGSLNRLYKNKHDGTFVDVAGKMGVANVNQTGTGASMGAVWGDYDHDGYEDLFLYKWGRPELFHNDGGKGFTRVSDKAGLPDWINAGTATWFDYNSDGLLDLFIGGYWADDVRLAHIENTRIMLESFEYANNGGRNYMLKNQGNGQFVDVTEKVGLQSTRWSLAVVAADLNDDNAPDLFLVNDYGVSELFLNVPGENGRRFREIGESCGIGQTPESGMTASVGDIFNTGALALYESNITEPGVLIQGNNLWVPTSQDPLRYQNMATVLGVEMGGWSFGAQFGDLNNDGHLDLYLTNGYVSGEPGTTYWYDFSQITGGHSSIISDAANWPAMNGRSLSGYQRKRLWLNDGAGGFTEVSQAVGATDRLCGRAVVLADLQNRGVLDVLVANQWGPFLLYRNHVDPDNHWITFKLEGTVSNRSAIGAQVRVFWNDQQQLQEVVAASGYSAQSPLRLHFGLGPHAEVDKVAIRWPSGTRQVLESPEVDRIHHIREPR